MFSYRSKSRASGALLVLCLIAANCYAQDTNSTGVDSITKESIQTTLDAIEASASLSDSAKSAASRLYKESLSELEKSAQLTAQRDEFTSRIDSVDADRNSITETLRAEPQQASIDTSGMTLDELETQVRQRQADAQKANDELAGLEAAQAIRDRRRTEIPQLVATLTDLTKAPPPDARADATPEVAEAQRILYELRKRNAELELQSIQQERAFYTADLELLPKRVEVSRRNATLINDEFRLWQQAAASRRQQERQNQTVDARAVVEETSAELKKYAEDNLTLTEESTDLAEKIRLTRKLAQDANDRAEKLSRDFDATKDRLDDDAGITESMGDHLRQQRSTLPSPRALKLSSRERREDIYDVRDRRYEITQQLTALSPPEASVQRELKKLPDSVASDRRETLKAELDTLLKSRRDLLLALQRDYGVYLDDLVDVNVQEERQIVISQRFLDFINEKVLWIRSTRPASVDDLGESLKAMTSLGKQLSDEWRNLVRSVPSSLVRRPLPQTMVLILAIILIMSRSLYARRIADLGVLASRSTCLDYSVTLKALAWSILRAATVPTFLMWLVLNLQYTGESGQSAIAYPLSRAIFAAAGVLFTLSLWSNLICPGGIGDAHFDWSDDVLQLTRTNLIWLTPLLVITTTIDVYAHSVNDPSWERSIGRVSVILGQLALAMFLFRMLSPAHGVFKQYLDRHADGWAYRLRKIWFSLLVGLPILFAGLAFSGYVYATSRLVDHLCRSLAFLGILFLLEELSLRWLRLNRRGLALAQARERLEASNPNDDAGTTQRSGGVVADEQIDLHEVNQQTERLITSFGIVVAILGLYFIWVDVLPALAKLDEIHLWRTTIELTQSVRATEGSDLPANAVATVQVVEWITLRHLLGAVLILFAMLVGVRNVPGLLEIAILQHLPLDAALRFAIKTVTRYAIIIAGSTAALGALGIGWSKVQWLIAAVSVGLGFGLQEIFANFVSGLILLFERPLRAGDIVTVGDVTGKVVQIKTRATTIQDWDRKELVVPNKTFITSNLLNWTLTDTTNRVVILVGVAYGSNVAKAREILLEVATDQPQILDEPSPSVTFDQFGDSALNLTLRAYLPDMGERLSVVHQMHEQIHERFAEAGIEIPFPQRDLHIRGGDGTITIANGNSHQAQSAGSSEAQDKPTR